MSYLNTIASIHIADVAKTSHVHVKSVMENAERGTVTIEYEQNECWQSLDYTVTLDSGGRFVQPK
ncbi:hypothetical protein ACFGWH_03585 [Pasteurella multocida]